MLSDCLLAQRQPGNLHIMLVLEPVLLGCPILIAIGLAPVSDS